MAWIKSIEHKEGYRKVQPTQLVASVKIFTPEDGSAVVQIDTYGSEDRLVPGKTSQTLQFGRESAAQLFAILKETYGF